MAEPMQFPQYRRYLNGRNYFCFQSLNAFEEIRSLGSKWLIEKHEVKILPDRNLVHDLVFEYQGIAEVIDPEAYEKVRKVAVAANL
ncbi:MAG: hypothetical protein M3R17_16515 [Bacteroidota bacterium]|nr:hypothetical protein [Bacteroidota bacterium]